MNRPFIRVLGVALAVGACHRATDLPSNPPPPPIGNPPPPDAELPIAELPTQNPPAPPDLPTWDAVLSGHPEGATNPPRPLLVVSKTPPACFKDWLPAMRPPDEEVMALHGRVVETPADAGGATQIQCPEGQPQTLLESAARRAAGMK